MRGVLLLFFAIVILLTVVGCAPEIELEVIPEEEPLKDEEVMKEEPEVSLPPVVPLTEQVCTDSDGGKDTSVKGRTCINGKCEEDICSADGVIENYCLSAGDLSEEFIACTCEDGACVDLPKPTPTAPIAPPAELPQIQFMCTPIVVNGPSQNKIDLVFISDGFTPQTMPLFDSSVDWALDWDGTSNGQFSKSPFKQNKDKFNVFKISSDMVSTCGGCTRGPSTVNCEPKKHVFDISKQACGIEADFIIQLYYQTCPDGNRRTAIARGGEYRTVPTDLLIWSEGLDTSTTKYILQTQMPHEFGHAVGQFTEEYIFVDRPYVEQWNFPNVDNTGCFKWCSGQINTALPCYQTYLTWLECVHQPCLNVDKEYEEYACGTNAQIKACGEAAFETEKAANRDLEACNIGIDCMDGTGCFWGGGRSLRNWRPTYNSIMRGGSDYGVWNEQILQNRINDLAGTS